MTGQARPAASEDRLTALVGLYQAEKSDLAGGLATTVAVFSLAIAYAIGIVTSGDKFGHGVAWDVVAFLCIPLWGAAIFNGMSMANASSHDVSVGLIEDEIFRVAFPTCSPDGDMRSAIGSRVGDSIYNITKADWIFRASTLVVYGGFLIAVFAITLYTWLMAFSHCSPPIRWVSASLYCGLAVIAGWVWIAASRHSSRLRDRADQELGIVRRLKSD